MSAEYSEREQRIQAALQEIGPPPAGPDDEDDIDGPAVLTRWLVITEWMAPDGVRWIGKTRSEGTSDWDADGLALYSLRGGW